MPDATPPKLTLLLLATEDQFPGITGVDRMTWAEAQMSGHESFGLFDRIVATPPQFPASRDGHRRQQMTESLVRRVAGGAEVVFLLPPWVENVASPPSPFHRAEYLLRDVTGARLEHRLDPNAVPLVFDPAAPPRLRSFLARHKPDAVVRVLADPFGFGPLVPHAVLAGFAHLDEDPCVVAGFPGSGMWLVLPWRPDDALVDVLALLDDAAVLRQARDERTAQVPGGAALVRAPLRQVRPDPTTAIGKLLARLEKANGRFVGIGREAHKDVSRLRKMYGIRIETARDARRRGVELPKGKTGYRLGPPD